MTDYRLTPGETYSYKIRSYKTVSGVRSYSVYSVPVSIQILGVPVIKSAERTSTGTALVTWNAVGGASGYSLSGQRLKRVITR